VRYEKTPRKGCSRSPFLCLQGRRYIAERKDARERCAGRDGRFGHPVLARHLYLHVHRRYSRSRTSCAPRHSDILSIIAERKDARERCAGRDGRFGHPVLARHLYLHVHRRYSRSRTSCAPRHSDILSIIAERREARAPLPHKRAPQEARRALPSRAAHSISSVSASS
jgi:uncharacterized Zn-finger protein